MFIADALDYDSHVFVPFPGTDNCSTWSVDLQRSFAKYIRGQPDQYVAFSIQGTTPSGDAFTTLFNTLREMCYLGYYTKGCDTQNSAAGDDGVIKVGSNYRKVLSRVLQLTSRTDTEASALGQIVKEVESGGLESIVFCSKWFFSTTNGLVCTRDIEKLLTTKQYYNRQNRHILGDPALHRVAIFEGVKSE